MNLTPIRAAVGAVVILVAAMTVGYLANRGDASDTAPSGEKTISSTVAPTPTTAGTVENMDPGARDGDGE